YALCLLLGIALILSKSLFIGGLSLCPKTYSFVEWLLLSIGLSTLFLSINLHWWSCFEFILTNPLCGNDYVLICETLALFGLLLSITQIVSSPHPNIQFYTTFFSLFFFVFLPQSYYFINQNPFTWLFDFLIMEPHRVSE
ncbi:unnamed protein product, partial [Didymodactylos carnosus]